MNLLDVQTILEGMAENPDHALDIVQVHALIFAVAVIRTLPESSIKLIEAILGLAYPDPSV